MFKDDTKKIPQKLGHEEYTGQRIPIYGRHTASLKANVGRKSTAWWKSKMDKKTEKESQ